jgi:Protein of unknown function (DUF4058)
MNPYLESPAWWPGVHARLIVAIANALENSLSMDYIVAVEKRVYQITPEDSILIGIPDAAIVQQSGKTPLTEGGTATMVRSTEAITVTLPMPEEVKEGYLEIRDVATGEVITTIEVLSPTNKRTGIGRNTYKAKRQAVLGSRTHLVEIDLLREGVGMDVVGALPASDYRILVSKSDDRPNGWLYAFDLTQPIPVIAIPLRSGEADIRLDMQELLNRVYEQARFGLSIDYSKPPEPPLREDLQDWATGLIQG